MYCAIRSAAHRAPCAENAIMNVKVIRASQEMSNYLPLPSKSCQWLKGGAGRSETLENRHSSTNISKRLWSSEKWKCKQAVERGHINAIHVILWWPEPLGNVSGWASMFKSLGPSSTTTGSFWTAGADNCSFLGTLLWPSHLLWHFLHRVHS